jgi:formate hydrogenlyase subunit 3/multisubunit Na+/H+ antiporter MnhD subunit
MSDLGRALIILGLLIAAVGVLLIISGKLPWLGRLPGDISIRKDNFSFYFPLTTCIIISAVVSFLLWLFRR